MSNKLFREEVLKEKTNKWVGEIVIIRPLSFTFYSVFSLILILIIVIFFMYGSYTKKTSVQGQLIPNRGLVKVYSIDAGIILKKYVEEGQNIKKGDVLYEISLERIGTQGDIQDAISSQVKLRNLSLKNELAQVKISQNNEKLEIKNKINTRNSFFVSLTRSRGWCYVVGEGAGIKKLKREIVEILNNFPKFNFTSPLKVEVTGKLDYLSRTDSEIDEINRIVNIINNNPEILHLLDESVLAKLNIKPEK